MPLLAQRGRAGVQLFLFLRAVFVTRDLLFLLKWQGAGVMARAVEGYVRIVKMFFCKLSCAVKMVIGGATASCLFASVAFAEETTRGNVVQWLNSMMETKVGLYILSLGLFSLIILYLRVLFGPRGLCREKEWDERNEQMRQEEARQHSEKGDV